MQKDRPACAGRSFCIPVVFSFLTYDGGTPVSAGSHWKGLCRAQGVPARLIR